jgi:hypothetical protein
MILACESRNSKEMQIHADWITLTLPNGWELQTPRTFKDTTVQGVDSHPGYIYSTSDSILLEFDSGGEMLMTEECDFDKQVRDAENSISSGFYKDFYKVPTEHKAFVDTIDNKIAVIVIPTQTGRGTVDISISDCKSGLWLGITGKNLSAKKEKLIRDIFTTIKLRNSTEP